MHLMGRLVYVECEPQLRQITVWAWEGAAMTNRSTRSISVKEFNLWLIPLEADAWNKNLPTV